MRQTGRSLSQKGGVILEALVGLAIFSIGIIGLLSSVAVSVGLSADSRYRVEAMAMADELLGEMAAVDASTLGSSYSNGSARFLSWKNTLVDRLPNGNANIVFDSGAFPGSTYATLTITWKSPEKSASDEDGQYVTSTYYR